jgi:hypothetical protein
MLGQIRHRAMRDAGSGATITSKAMLLGMTAHSTGEGRMNNLVLTVIGIAVMQALIVLLTILPDREIKQLHERIAKQQLLIVELRAWVAEIMQSSQPRRITPDREPIREPMEPVRREPIPKSIADEINVSEPVVTPKDLPETVQPCTTEEEAAPAMNTNNWLKEIQSAQPRQMKPEPIAEPEPTIKPDTTRPPLTEDEIRDKARAIVTVLHGAPPAKLA